MLVLADAQPLGGDVHVALPGALAVAHALEDAADVRDPVPLGVVESDDESEKDCVWVGEMTPVTVTRAEALRETDGDMVAELQPVGESVPVELNEDVGDAVTGGCAVGDCEPVVLAVDVVDEDDVVVGVEESEPVTIGAVGEMDGDTETLLDSAPVAVADGVAVEVIVPLPAPPAEGL